MIAVVVAQDDAPAPCFRLPPLNWGFQRLEDRGVAAFTRRERLTIVRQIAQVPIASVDARLHRLNDLQPLKRVKLLNLHKIRGTSQRGVQSGSKNGARRSANRVKLICV